MDAEREFIDVCSLAAQVEYADFGIGHTAVEAGFGIWLWTQRYQSFTWKSVESGGLECKASLFDLWAPRLS